MREFVKTSKFEHSLSVLHQNLSCIVLAISHRNRQTAYTCHTRISEFTHCVKVRKRRPVTRTMNGAVVACLLNIAAVVTKEGTN